jgi:hypothetical protein
MTTTDLREAYPGAADAVEIVDRITSKTSWSIARRLPDAIAVVQGMKDVVDCLAGRKLLSDDQQAIFAVRHQFDHPHFRAYILAKLGAM